MNTNTFHNLSYGVYIISSLDGSRSTGCVANSVMQMVFILPIARPIITVFLCILCIYELLLGIMNLSLLNKKSYSRFLKPCAQFLDHYQHSSSSRKN